MRTLEARLPASQTNGRLLAPQLAHLDFRIVGGQGRLIETARPHYSKTPFQEIVKGISLAAFLAPGMINDLQAITQQMLTDSQNPHLAYSMPNQHSVLFSANLPAMQTVETTHNQTIYNLSQDMAVQAANGAAGLFEQFFEDKLGQMHPRQVKAALSVMDFDGGSNISATDLVRLAVKRLEKLGASPREIAIGALASVVGIYPDKEKLGKWWINEWKERKGGGNVASLRVKSEKQSMLKTIETQLEKHIRSWQSGDGWGAKAEQQATTDYFAFPGDWLNRKIFTELERKTEIGGGKAPVTFESSALSIAFEKSGLANGITCRTGWLNGAKPDDNPKKDTDADSFRDVFYVFCQGPQIVREKLLKSVIAELAGNDLYRLDVDGTTLDPESQDGDNSVIAFLENAGNNAKSWNIPEVLAKSEEGKDIQQPQVTESTPQEPSIQRPEAEKSIEFPTFITPKNKQVKVDFGGGNTTRLDRVKEEAKKYGIIVDVSPQGNVSFYCSGYCTMQQIMEFSNELGIPPDTINVERLLEKPITTIILTPDAGQPEKLATNTPGAPQSKTPTPPENGKKGKPQSGLGDATIVGGAVCGLGLLAGGWVLAKMLRTGWKKDGGSKKNNEPDEEQLTTDTVPEESAENPPPSNAAPSTENRMSPVKLQAHIDLTEDLKRRIFPGFYQITDAQDRKEAEISDFLFRLQQQMSIFEQSGRTFKALEVQRGIEILQANRAKYISGTWKNINEFLTSLSPPEEQISWF